MLDQFRIEQIRMMSSNGGMMVNSSTDANNYKKDETGAVDYTSEVLDLKVYFQHQTLSLMFLPLLSYTKY